MWTLDKIYEYLNKNLSENRYIHTLGVIEVARKLAQLNGENEYNAEVAALIHDMAKQMSFEEQIEVLKANNKEIDEIEFNSPQILHGFVGAILANKVMNINNEDILNAVAYHTIGRKSMSTLEKIIYIADYIEPNRKYPGVEELREITYSNLDEGVLKGLENTMIFVIKQGELVHPVTLEARNQLLLNLKKSKM